MQKELLSAYIDGEHNSNEFTSELCNNTELKQSWENFHFVRSVMREENNHFLGPDFTVKMEALIDAEPEIVKSTIIDQPMPDEVAQLPFVQKLKALFSPLAQIAVAAAVCLVAVLGVQTFNTTQADKTEDMPVLQTMPFINSTQEVSYNAPAKDVLTPTKIEEKNKLIDEKLKDIEAQQKNK